MLSFEGQKIHGATKHNISTIDCQHSGPANGILVFVSGNLQLPGEEHRHGFSQVHITIVATCMGDKACLERTRRLIERQAKNSLFVKKLISSGLFEERSNLGTPSTINSKEMRRKNVRPTLEDSGENAEILLTEYEKFRRKRVSRNNEYLSQLGLTNRKETNYIGNEKGKQKEIKYRVPTTRRSQRICDSTAHHALGGNNSCDDVQPGIMHSDVHLDKIHGDAQLDIEHGDAQLDIEHGDAQHHEDLLTQSLKEIIEKHRSQGTENMQKLFARVIKDVFEEKSTKIGSDITTHDTLNVGKDGEFQVAERNEDILLASNVPITSSDGTNKSEKNIGNGLNMEDVPAFVKRRRLSQNLYRSTEKDAKQRKLEGKKPFLVEVSRDGEPIGKNVARWASELGMRCRTHLDICKTNFADQDPRNVEIVIQKMENNFETTGGKISRRYYKKKMRILMNNFRYTCRKTIMDGKDRLQSTLSPRQWEALKESMSSEEYLIKSCRGKRARDNVTAGYTFGRGGLQAKKDKFGMENNNKEASVEEIVNYMETLDPRSNNNMSWKSSPSNEISQPSIARHVIASADHFSSNDGYEQTMNCIHGLTEKVSQLAASAARMDGLAETVSQLATSVKPIVSTWNVHNFMDANKSNSIKAAQKCFDANKAADIDSDCDELVDMNVDQHSYSCGKVESTVHTGKDALNRPIYKAPQFEKDVDSEHVELDEDLYDIQRRLHVKSKKNIHELQEGDKVRVLDPFDSAAVGVGRIHSLSIIHGENLKGTSDANVELVRVTSNVPLVYEDKLDGVIRLKEKEGSFARWPIIFLEKMN